MNRWVSKTIVSHQGLEKRARGVKRPPSIKHLYIMKIRLAIMFLCFASSAFSQLPEIIAVGGGGVEMDWASEEKDSDPDGPGYFYNDCAQGIIPMSASSTLAGQKSKNYEIQNINDDDPKTAWVEGKLDYGIGESFEIKAPAVNEIYNGYQASPKSWAKNSRVKTFKVYKNNIPLCTLELTDEMGGQQFELPDYTDYNPEKEHTYKFEILEVYKGSKWKDVAISEINLVLCCFSETTTIQSSLHPISISSLEKGATIFSVDIETGELSNSEVIKTTKQTHLSLLQISSATKAIEVTFNHPLYIKGHGFLSIHTYMELKNIEHYEALVDTVEFLTWDAEGEQLVYEKLKSIVSVTGVFETYSIRKLSTGKAFIANGFVTKLY